MSPRSGQVLSNTRVCAEHYLLSFRVPAFEAAAPGQFVHLGATSEHLNLAGRSEGTLVCGQGFSTPFLRRAFSIGRLVRAARHVEIGIMLRVVGTGTRWLSSLKAGDPVSVLGPLGRPFESAAPTSRVILVAGGVGLPPLAWYGHHLCKVGGKVFGILGARSRGLVALYEGSRLERFEELLPLMDGRAASEFPAWFVASDDGSIGFRGTAVNALEHVLNRQRLDFSDWTVFTCGPDRMMHGVAEVCSTHGLRCFVCLEREMACGTGTCQSCAVAVNDLQAPDGWRYKLCCRDGPVFHAQEIRWAESA